MVRMIPKGSKYFSILALSFFISCSENPSDALPDSNLSYLETYHCWPYNVKVYSLDRIVIDSLFSSYPDKNYFGNDPKFKLTTWSKYSDIDTSLWGGMDETLRQCDDHYNLISQGAEMYYAGVYKVFTVKNGDEKRVYDKILLLDMDGKRMHFFKDINKVY